MRAIILSLFALLTPIAVLAQTEQVKPMAKNVHPSFEVATIKPSNPDNRSQGFHTSGTRLFYENQTLKNLIAFAYGVHTKLILNGPAWMTVDRYDIRGTADAEGQPGVKQQQEMLQKLLADRFDLKIHREKRDMPIYSLTQFNGKAKIAPTTSTEDLPDQTGSNNDGVSSWVFTNNSMAQFADFLQYQLDRPVVDNTNLSGKFDFKLEWNQRPELNSTGTSLPGLFTAMQEQAGLKVEATKGAVDSLIIDDAKKPTAD